MYRGSRDGFAALDFHTKCDFLPSTLTLVETSLGYIFGGYTHACWTTGSGKSHYDPRAFLFSLVNKFGKPFVCKIADTKNAIYSRTSYGPTFGTNDIFICNNSNTESKSNVGLASYQKPDDIDDPNGVYFCDSRYFQVKEMEVFQIEST